MDCFFGLTAVCRILFQDCENCEGQFHKRSGIHMKQNPDRLKIFWIAVNSFLTENGKKGFQFFRYFILNPFRLLFYGDTENPEKKQRAGQQHHCRITGLSVSASSRIVSGIFYRISVKVFERKAKNLLRSQLFFPSPNHKILEFFFQLSFSGVSEENYDHLFRQKVVWNKSIDKICSGKAAAV